MKYLLIIIRLFFASILIISGFYHFFNPTFFNELIPDFLPKLVVNYGIGILEIALGIGLFIKGSRKKAAFGVLLLMLLFLPIHIWDALKENPMVGSKIAAYFRIFFQFILIGSAYLMCNKEK